MSSLILAESFKENRRNGVEMPLCDFYTVLAAFLAFHFLQMQQHIGRHFIEVEIGLPAPVGAGL